MRVPTQLRIVPAAGGWLDDAASALDAGPVYVAPEVADAASLEQALTQVVPQDGSIAVAVLPKNAALESAYTTYLLDELFGGSDYDTLVIAIGGDLQADSLRIDVKGSALTATGELRLSRHGLLVTAGTVSYYALEQVIVFDGGVKGTEPAFSADRLLLDALSGDVLLDGRYEFAGGLFTMRSPEAGGRLQLSLHQRGDELVYAAATEVSPALLERFRAYL